MFLDIGAARLGVKLEGHTKVSPETRAEPAKDTKNTVGAGEIVSFDALRMQSAFAEAPISP